MTSLHFIVNPTANLGAAEALWHQCTADLAEQQLAYTADLTHQVGDAKAFAQAFIKQQPHFTGKLIIVGGDDTISEVLTGLAHRAPPLPVGIIPAGKNNLWARRNGVPLNPHAALQRCLAATTPQTAVVGRFTDHPRGTQPAQSGYFVNQLSIGLLTHVYEIKQAYRMNPPTTWHTKLQHNWLTHWFERTNAYMSQEHFNVGVRVAEQTLLWRHAYQLYVVTDQQLLQQWHIKPLMATEALHLIVLRRNNIIARTWLKFAQFCGFAHRLPLVKQISDTTIKLSINALEFGASDHHPLGNKFFDLTLIQTAYPIW